jgi:hypothetical protein
MTGHQESTRRTCALNPSAADYNGSRPCREQISSLWATTTLQNPSSRSAHIGGSVRGYQAIFVPLAAVRSLGHSPLDGQPAVYLYIAALG